MILPSASGGRQTRYDAFISYGHAADAQLARALRDALHFLGAVGGAIYTRDAILVVIGPGWASARDARGALRLADSDDPVSWEVGLALASGRLLRRT